MQFVARALITEAYGDGDAYTLLMHAQFDTKR